MGVLTASYRKLVAHAPFFWRLNEGRLLQGDAYIYKCSKCDKFAVFFEERSNLALTPEQVYADSGLLYGLDGIDPVICPKCGQSDSFIEASESDLTELMKSEWAFVVSDSLLE